MNNGDKLRTLLEDTNYCIIQANGQRIYGLRNNNDFPNGPPKGTELFVGKLPRTIYEDELVPIFAKQAPIYQLRLMVDFAGRNRGYCFVRYFTREAADMAFRRLNNYEVRRGCRIGVFKSLDNTRLFIGGIPQDKSKLQLKEALEHHMDEIKNVIMYPAVYDSRRNRGYAFVEFENHRAAAIARRRVPNGSLMLWGSKILIDWAEPLPEPDPEIMSKVTTLYMRNLPHCMAFETLQKYIHDVINPKVITKMCLCTDFGFLHFTTRDAAANAITLLQNLRLYDRIVEVAWARPKMYSKKVSHKHVPSHYCLSLPAKQRWIIRKKYEAARWPRSDDDDDDVTSQHSSSDNAYCKSNYNKNYRVFNKPSTSRSYY